MKLRTPRWWYRPNRPPSRLARVALAPLGALWSAATAARLARGGCQDPGPPVICVGNVTLGGSGKTPIARTLAMRLRPRGVHVICRGHGGRLRGPVLVDPAAHSAADVGDEALLLAAVAPTWIGRDRAAAARAAAGAGAKVIVMDDGHQNARLKKSLSLLVVDGETRQGEWPFGAGGVFPAGPMREPLANALDRADAVVVLLPADLERPEPGLLALLAARPRLLARLEAVGPPPKGPQLGFAGIAKPWRFAAALRAAGCDLAAFQALPDHAPMSEARLARLSARAARLGAGLITTEKDWVRLPHPWRERVYAWRVRARFQDEAELTRLLARL